ncbi:MAG: hypothetical protein H8E28_03695 [Anaerolineae bacterium]|nr:hypothetical protein [Anaerolineae bacterium]MBL6966026.1 hypothetical protein [Anaerolineales bacterium]
MDTPHLSFKTLSQAVDFIASCLDQNQILRLTGQIQHFEQDRQRTQKLGPDYHANYFATHIFTQLQQIHTRSNLREIYAEQNFPNNETFHKLGGHMAELGCIHIDFQQQANGWVIQNIWMCR